MPTQASKQDILKAQKVALDNYDLIVNDPYQEGSKHFIGTRGSCRFCGKTAAGGATFGSEAHAISEFLGNRHLILREECDTCNQGFANHLEDHLSKLLKPFSVVGQVKGKRGIPSYKTKDKKSRIDTNHGTFEIVNHEDSIVSSICEETNTLEMVFTVEKFVPNKAFRAMIKYALSLMPESELGNFSCAIDYVKDLNCNIDLVNPCLLHLSLLPRFRASRCHAWICKKKPGTNDSLIDYLFVLITGCVQLQVVIPNDPQSKGIRKVKKNGIWFPPLVDVDYAIVIRPNLSSKVEEERLKLPFKFQFDSMTVVNDQNTSLQVIVEFILLPFKLLGKVFKKMISIFER